MSKLDIYTIPILSDNYVYILRCQETQHTAVVDPGDAKPILQFLQEKNWQLDTILCTHHHGDHVDGNKKLQKATNCRIIGNANDEKRIPGITETTSEGQQVKIGNATAQVFDTPGHTVGHISYYFPESQALFCGDTLFSAGCGRLFEGTPAHMVTAMEKILPLPDECQIYFGHEYTTSNIRFALSIEADNQELKNYQQQVEKTLAAGGYTSPTTLGLEKKINPFLRYNQPELRSQLQMETASDTEVFGTIRAKKDNF